MTGAAAATRAAAPALDYVEIPTRDGTVLSGVLYRADRDRALPTVLVATPYDKLSRRYVDYGHYFAAHGYAFVAIDVRGRYESEGESYLYGPHDGRDVCDVIAWIARQPWSTGRVGTLGGSYRGFVQLLAAAEGEPAHTCMVPLVAPDDHYDNVFPSGAFQLANSVRLAWILTRRTNQNEAAHGDWDAILRHLPLETLDVERLGFASRVWADFFEHPTRDDFWAGPGRRTAPGRSADDGYASLAIPGLHISGWYDQVSQATINNYLGMRDRGPRELRDRHRLVMGPWNHEIYLRADPEWGDRRLPEAADLDVGALVLEWFDAWLRDEPGELAEQPPVLIYVMGADEWRHEHEWPLARAVDTPFYLHGAGRANSAAGDGRLSTEPPGEEPADAFAYDPSDPVPTLGGNCALVDAPAGPADQRPLDGREDVLVYVTEPLAQDVEVTGRVHLDLYAASDRTDTDFTAKLIDLAPDGEATLVLEGIVRARFRDSFTEPRPLVPGQAERFHVDLWSTSIVFARGHRIRLDVSSSNFPKYDRNPNTGAAFGRDDVLETARQTVFHDAARPSALVLPIVPSDPR